MNLPTKLAWRYLFARKSTNAINIITLIAAFGVAIGAAALILLLSVFNGFEDLIMGLYNNLNPDVRITAAKGKTFDLQPGQVAGLYDLDGVEVVAESLAETAIIGYADKQSAARITGVSDNYALINGVDSLVRDGEYRLDDSTLVLREAIVSDGVANVLGIDPFNRIERLTAFMLRPQRRGSSPLLTGRSNYKRKDFRPAGVISSQESAGRQTILVHIDEARELLSLSDSTVSALQLRLHPDAVHESTLDRIRTYLGPDFVVENRYEQEKDIFAVITIEKWVSFAIACLMMILISFNLIGALWMIVLEKTRDVSVLRSLGMTTAEVRGVFVRVGLFLCFLGLLAGFGIAIVLYAAQKTFGLITLPGMGQEAYPIAFRWHDFPMVALTVLIIGFLATLLPAFRAGNIPAIIAEE